MHDLIYFFQICKGNFLCELFLLITFDVDVEVEFALVASWGHSWVGGVGQGASLLQVTIAGFGQAECDPVDHDTCFSTRRIQLMQAWVRFLDNAFYVQEANLSSPSER